MIIIFITNVQISTLDGGRACQNKLKTRDIHVITLIQKCCSRYCHHRQARIQSNSDWLKIQENNIPRCKMQINISLKNMFLPCLLSMLITNPLFPIIISNRVIKKKIYLIHHNLKDLCILKLNRIGKGKTILLIEWLNFHIMMQ
jgi:hypothetical protein